jgi:hypothetical protein
VRRLLVALVATGILTSCIPGIGDCAMKPFAAAPLAVIAPGVGSVDRPVATSCASTVAFDGRTYFRSGGDGAWTVTLDDLEPIGRATAANELAWEDPTVYEIEGVDRADAVAMRYGSGTTIAVLLAGDLPASLCAFVPDPENVPACAPGS